MGNSQRIRILYLSANPNSQRRLNLDEEVRLIKDRIQRAQYRERFDFQVEPALRASQLPFHLMSCSPDIVHFSGHGMDNGSLLFQLDGAGQMQAIPPDTLAGLFKTLKKGIKCVVLSACYSEKQAAAIVQSIPCVIGMASAVPDSAAIAFAAGFYEALAFAKSIGDSFDLGCTQIALTPAEGEARSREHRDLAALPGEAGPAPSAAIPRLLARPDVDPRKLFLISEGESSGEVAPTTPPASPAAAPRHELSITLPQLAQLLHKMLTTTKRWGEALEDMAKPGNPAGRPAITPEEAAVLQELLSVHTIMGVSQTPFSFLIERYCEQPTPSGWLAIKDQLEALASHYQASLAAAAKVKGSFLVEHYGTYASLLSGLKARDAVFRTFGKIDEPQGADDIAALREIAQIYEELMNTSERDRATLVAYMKG